MYTRINSLLLEIAIAIDISSSGSTPGGKHDTFFFTICVILYWAPHSYL